MVTEQLARMLMSVSFFLGMGFMWGFWILTSLLENRKIQKQKAILKLLKNKEDKEFFAETWGLN